MTGVYWSGMVVYFAAEYPTSAWLQSDQVIHVGVDSIVFQNVALKTAVATLKGVDENLLTTNASGKANKKINLSFYTADADKNGALALNALSEHLYFQLHQSKQPDTVWELYIRDSSKLDMHLSEAADTDVRTQSSSESVTFENVNPEMFAKMLTDRFGHHIRATGIPERRFNLTLRSETFTELQKELLSDLGLGMRGQKDDIEMLYIEFNGNK